MYIEIWIEISIEISRICLFWLSSPCVDALRILKQAPSL